MFFSTISLISTAGCLSEILAKIGTTGPISTKFHQITQNPLIAETSQSKISNRSALFTFSTQRQKPTPHPEYWPTPLRRSERHCSVPRACPQEPDQYPPLAFRHLTRPCWNGIACSLPARHPRRQRPAGPTRSPPVAAGCSRHRRTLTPRAFWRGSIRMSHGIGGCQNSSHP